MGECVRVLDWRRLGKQRVECMQILAALRSRRVGADVQPRGWTNHPATLMWEGYDSALGVYMTLCVEEWIRRGYVNNMSTPYSRETFLAHPGWYDAQELVPDGREAPLPPWWGDERVHKSHRAALMAKDPEWYRQWNWRVLPVVDYHWPTKTDPEFTSDPIHPGSTIAALTTRRGISRRRSADGTRG